MHFRSQSADAPFCANLGEPQAMVRTIIEALPDGAMVFDAEQQLVFANAHAEAWLQGTADPLVLIDPRSERLLPADRTPLARALRGVSSEREQYMIRARRGGSRWIECGARPFKSSSGNNIGAIFVFHDITDQRKQDFASEAATQLRDFIYRENLAGIIHCTVDGRILDCNDAILRMWGYSSREELFAVRAPQLHYDPVDRDLMVRRLTAAGQLNEYEVCFRRRDGTRCWALLNVRLLDAPPDQVGGSIVATVIDITERKIWEETLRLSEQRFSAFMRHLPGVAFIKDLTGRLIRLLQRSGMDALP